MGIPDKLSLVSEESPDLSEMLCPEPTSLHFHQPFLFHYDEMDCSLVQQVVMEHISGNSKQSGFKSTKPVGICQSIGTTHVQIFNPTYYSSHPSLTKAFFSFFFFHFLFLGVGSCFWEHNKRPNGQVVGNTPHVRPIGLGYGKVFFNRGTGDQMELCLLHFLGLSFCDFFCALHDFVQWFCLFCMFYKNIFFSFFFFFFLHVLLSQTNFEPYNLSREDEHTNHQHKFQL